MAVTERTTSVYPGEHAALLLGGFSSKRFNTAIRCWAMLMARKTAELAGTLDADEWRCLAEALAGIEMEPEIESPGRAIGESLEARHRVEGVGCTFFKKDADQRVNQLAQQLAQMDYPTAWAVLSAVQFFLTHRRRIAEGDPWWTLPYRKKCVEEAGERGKKAKR